MPNALLLLAGPAFIAGSFALMVQRVEPFADHFYLFAWYGIIFTFDRLIARREGRSLIARCGPGFWLLLIWSAAVWYFFELVNFRIQNWYYVFVTDRTLNRVVGTFFAFATVFPGIFWIDHYLSLLGVARSIPGRVLALTPARLLRLQLLGVLFLVLPLIWPRYFFALVWTSTFLIVAPINYRRGVNGLFRQLERGEYGPLLRMLLAGLIAGLFWESLNFWARAKWIYTVPFFEDIKLFEMPVLGFFGFPPFAVECACLYRFLVWHRLAPAFGAYTQQKPGPVQPGAAVVSSGRPIAALAGAALAIAFSLAVHVGVDRWTVASLTPRVAQVEALPAATRTALADVGVHYLTDLEGHGAGELWERVEAGLGARQTADVRRVASLYLHEGIGVRHGNLLVRAGFTSLGSLRGLSADQVLERLRPLAGDGVLPTPARVRLWLHRLPG